MTGGGCGEGEDVREEECGMAKSEMRRMAEGRVWDGEE